MVRQIKFNDLPETEKEVLKTIKAFKQFNYYDQETGKSVKYNLFIPESYDPNKKYPLVLFIHDAGVVGHDTRNTLLQGLGAIVWALPSEQIKRECFVLAPQFSSVIVNDESEYTPEIIATKNLIDEVVQRYPIDQTRIYTTGQSMGCMASIAMLIAYPDLFAAALLVAGQWDATKMAALSDANLWIVVSEGDLKASSGMNASVNALEAAGANVSRATWDARTGEQALSAAAKMMMSKNVNIYYCLLQKGTLVPDGVEDTPLNNHLQTWTLVYQIEALREWVFSQARSV